MFEPRTTSARKIPGLGPGIFFLAWVATVTAGAPLDLAAELFAEGQWAAARAESLRIPAGDPAAARARVLASVSGLRLGLDRTAAKAALAEAWRDAAVDLETRCMAAYESGRAEAADGAAAEARAAWRFAYLNTREAPLFWRAGCSLYFQLREDGAGQREEAELWRSLLSCRAAWPPDVWGECRPGPGARSSAGSLPGQWVVSFYRAQISPAIGARCDLEPSCSEYFRQASRAHGLLGVPIMADRFVREPSVVAAKAHTVEMPGGRIRYADPLCDHDEWMKGRR